MAMRDHLNEAAYSLRRSAIREFSRMAAARENCVRLTLGEPDFATPDAVCNAAAESLQAGDTHYIENNGARELRIRIAEYEREKNGMDYDADEIIVTSGATEALFVSLLGIINPGDEVIIPVPAFVLYEEIVLLARGVPVFLDTAEDDFQIRSDAIDSLITDRTKAVILNSPNNPTGCVYDDKSLRAVRDAVSGKSIFVICDDVYRQLCYTDNYHSFAENRDLREQILVVQSFSKPYAMTGWRMGYLMADSQVKERLELIHQFDVVSTPSMFQKAGIAALQTDPSKMVVEYKKRRDYVTGRLREIGMNLKIPDGAFYAFPSIANYGTDSMSFAIRLLNEAGVAVTPGIAFGSDRYIRISYCCSMDALREGTDRLEKFLKQYE